MTAFLITNILLGFGLAMDAFSVSVANGLREPDMTLNRRIFMAGVYAFFQILMPVAGWVLVSSAVALFNGLRQFIPFISLILLLFIGIRMIREGMGWEAGTAGVKPSVSVRELLIQGIATSIDALSVGFAFALYDALYVLPAAFIIGVVTFIVCLTGLEIGRAVGIRFTGGSGIAGGIILILVGISIFIRG